MARKLLTLLAFTCLLLNLISNNVNVSAADTETSTPKGLDSKKLNDKANGASRGPIAKQASDNATKKTVDENDNEDEYNKKEDGSISVSEKGKKAIVKKNNSEDQVLEKEVDKEDTDSPQDKGHQNRRQNGRGRRRRRNNLRNRSRRGPNAETDFQELPVSENAQEEEQDYGGGVTTDDVKDLQSATETNKEELNSSPEVPKNTQQTKGKLKANNSTQRRAQRKRANAAKNRKRNGNARRNAKKPKARRPKARPARRPPARSARRSTRKFMLNGIQFPRNNRGKVANGNRQQRQKGRAGRKSNIRRRH